MTLTIDPSLHNFVGLLRLPPPSPSPPPLYLQKYIRTEIHKAALFIQAQEETELNVRKQSGHAERPIHHHPCVSAEWEGHGTGDGLVGAHLSGRRVLNTDVEF